MQKTRLTYSHRVPPDDLEAPRRGQVNSSREAPSVYNERSRFCGVALRVIAIVVQPHLADLLGDITDTVDGNNCWRFRAVGAVVSIRLPRVRYRLADIERAALLA